MPKGSPAKTATKGHTPFNSASVFSRLIASSTFIDFSAGSICLSRPQRTFPGPTSTKSSAPAAFERLATQSTQRTAPVTWRMSASRAASAVVTSAAGDVGRHGDARIAHREARQHPRHLLLRGLHQRAMEGSADRQHDGAARAFGFAESGGLFDRRGSAGDDSLTGRIQVGGLNNEAGFARGFGAGLGHLRRRRERARQPWRPARQELPFAWLRRGLSQRAAHRRMRACRPRRAPTIRPASAPPQAPAQYRVRRGRGPRRCSPP